MNREQSADMQPLGSRSSREVLDDHLRIATRWGSDSDVRRSLEEDLRRNFSADCVVLINRGTFRGHHGIRQLARMLAEELPEHRAFEYGYRAAEGRMAFLEWTYEDARATVSDGVDSYLIENGRIVAQTIHYTVERLR